MPAQNLFEYAIVRVVPQVEREEFINVGVILYCPKQKFLDALCILNENRLSCFPCKSDAGQIQEYLDAFVLICRGEENSGQVGKLPIAERFRWLTATRSTVIQTSKVHPGLCDDAGDMLKKIYEQFVL